MVAETLCRLCAETKPVIDLFHIKDENWTKQNLDMKVKQFFHIKILSTDQLPKAICSKCCEKVNITWEFNEKVQQAQEILRSLITTTTTISDNENNSVDDYDSDTPLINILKADLQQKRNDQETLPIEFVDCVRDENKRITTTENSNKRKRKRKPVRSKGRKTRTKSLNEFDDQESDDNDDNDDDDDDNNDNVSVLSGVSSAERNEDGSLILRNGLKGWDSYPWSCIDCNEKLNSIIELKNHHQTAHNQMPKYFCCDCSKIYAKYYVFITHVRFHRYHLKFCCDVCNKFFANRKLLERHLETHFEARPYLCTTCGKSFRKQSVLIMHARCHLPIEMKNKYQCDQCPKRFGTKPNLMTHKRIHAGVRDYTCEQCGKSFIQKGNLENHMLTHVAAQPYSCDVCGKSFKALMRLKKHTSVHSGLKPHKCDVCGREFRERSTLKEHLRIHTGAMPFACEFCGKCFRFKGVLTTHRRQHTGERPYSCQECQHHFTNWPNYNKHMKRRHGINTSVTTRKPQTIPPTGKPNRNPPGTVVVPPNAAPTQLVLIQEPKFVTTDTYVEQETQTFITTGASTLPILLSQPQLTTANENRITTTPIATVNMQQQSYYMLPGVYNIQGMNAEIIQQVQQ